ncbi:hypothetical protein ACJIZ3_014357 [Penstemon smallii]|uniref:Uncharacterized protein n=1 Tax=Penstemon smallii TaxID=265156 RepID=A0ABD3RK37_9LAMI
MITGHQCKTHWFRQNLIVEKLSGSINNGIEKMPDIRTFACASLVGTICLYRIAVKFQELNSYIMLEALVGGYLKQRLAQRENIVKP